MGKIKETQQLTKAIRNAGKSAKYEHRNNK